MCCSPAKMMHPEVLLEEEVRFHRKKKSLVLHFHPKTVPKSHQKPSQTSSVFWKKFPRWRCGGEHSQNVGGTCRASRLSGAAEGSLCPSRSEGPTATLGSSRGGGGAGGCPRGALGVFQRWVGGKISRKICGFMLFHIFCRKRSVKSGWLSPSISRVWVKNTKPVLQKNITKCYLILTKC